MSTKLSLVYITNPDLKTAQRISKHLLHRRLIACVNIFPIQSIYWWKGRLEQAREYVVLAKTQNKLYARVKSEVEKIHPYEVPCIVRLDGECNESFGKWLKRETAMI
jgi:periplasmic divalent cation tolerance protein